MRFWIGVHLPHLPLETFRPCWSEPGEHVVIDREHVCALSQQAREAGVRMGMRRGGVAAIAPEATIHDRVSESEQTALSSIALTLLQYTPEVAYAQDWSLILDVTASLRAFGGRLALCRLIRTSVNALGFTVQIGAAPTAKGAWLLAQYLPAAGKRTPLNVRRIITIERMTQRLDLLPCSLLPELRPYHEWLDGIGCRMFSDLRKLPRAGLQRRTNKDVLHALDQAYGNAPELFEWVTAPLTFSAKLEMPDRIEHAEAVLFGAKRLILQMIGWLVALQNAVSHFVLWLEHERGRLAVAPTPVDIALAEPAWHEEHLVRLLKERLGRLELTAPIIAIRLEVAQVSPMLPPTESLFPEPGGTSADYSRLLELLTARLGSDSVLSPIPRDDHRPECCNAWQVSTTGKQRAVVAQEGLFRPFWLLEKPIELLLRDHRPFYGSPLRLISGPERIEAGWWNGLVVRDYFIAQGAEAACYWIYRERAQDEVHWFLQGLFA